MYKTEKNSICIEIYSNSVKGIENSIRKSVDSMIDINKDYYNGVGKMNEIVKNNFESTVRGTIDHLTSTIQSGISASGLQPEDVKKDIIKPFFRFA